LPVRVPAILVILSLIASVALAATPEPVRAGAQKVVIIVGPIGATTSNYRAKGDQIAATATAAGAQVVKVYSPNATWAKVREAVDGANVIVYLGHGNGFPNPYSATQNTDRVNGWGLNMIAGKDAKDPTGDGDVINQSLVYCGEKALLGTLSSADGAAQRQYCSGGPISPAPNFVMIYSNACYAPGAGEQRPAPDEEVAVARVANFSRPILALGGTYLATDLGSAKLVELVLTERGTAFGEIFEMGNGFSAPALRRFDHPDASGSEVWVQKTAGWGGDADYWYAFAGKPARTPAGSLVAYTPPGPKYIAFTDIADSPFRGDIRWLAATGITGGCAPSRFCPNKTVTREQMASFLARALKLPSATQDYFSDDDGSIHEGDINRLAASGITGGCAAGRFCPGQPVTRDQMASFLVRAFGAPHTSVDYFDDDAGSAHQGNINRLAAAGVTGGCAERRFCPGSSVTRGQMAAFLKRAFARS
jgi:hypothetical protein